MLDIIFITAASVLIVLLVAWQAALLAKNEPRRQAERDAAAVKRASTMANAPRPKDPMGRLVYLLRRRKWARRGLSGVSAVAFTVAIALIGYPFYTNLITDRIQERLGRELTSDSLRQAYLERRVAEGDSLTRILIPAIGVDVVVVEGTGADALRAGAGHYKSTPLPCENGNVGIAGHRTTYGRPFANLDLLKPGDTITLETPIGSCTYTVNPVAEGRTANAKDRGAFIIEPTDLTVVANSSSPMVTLTTCHPKGSAAKRLVIQATLSSTGGAPASSGGA